MLQDWYVKRRKYARRAIDVDRYAAFMIAFLERSLLSGPQPSQPLR
jgi:hypothetical protein